MKQIQSGARRDRRRTGLAIALVACLAAPAVGPAAAAGTAGGEAGTVVVRIVDPTGAGPAEASAVALLGTGPEGGVLAESGRVSGQAEFAGLQLAPEGTYMVRVTAGGIDYWARQSGAQLLAGPLTVQVFPTVGSSAAASIEDLNLILRRTETELQIEALLTIGNTGSPARTIVPTPSSLELAWPAGSQGIQIAQLSVPDAPLIGPEIAAEGRIGLPVPLRPGTSRLRVTGSIPYGGRAEIPVGSSLPLHRWSVLAAPPDLQIEGGELTAQPDASDGHRRHHGQALAAGEQVVLVVSGGSVLDVAGDEALQEEEETAEQRAARAEQRTSGALLWVLAFAALAVLYVAVRRRGARRRQP